MSVFYIVNKKLDLINSMVKNNDITNLKQLKYWLNRALDDDLSLNYYYDDLGDGMEYISNLEFDLTEYNSICYPIGWHIDLIASILKIKYSEYDLRQIAHNSTLNLLKLWDMHLFNSKYGNILRLFETDYFKSFNSDDIAYKYLKGSLESDLSESSKILYLIQVLELGGF